MHSRNWEGGARIDGWISGDLRMEQRLHCCEGVTRFSVSCTPPPSQLLMPHILQPHGRHILGAHGTAIQMPHKLKSTLGQTLDLCKTRSSNFSPNSWTSVRVSCPNSASSTPLSKN